jgi:FkbM family methyltransferase
MELGGGIGMVAIACAKVTGSERVFSYEANPELEPLIRDNYALNGVEPTLKMCMLGAETGKRIFYVSERFSQSSVFDIDKKGTKIEVPITPFNAEVRLVRPTVLVVDIEGSEAELLDYADLSTVEKLLLEVHPDIIGVGRANVLRKRLRRMSFAETAHAGRCFLFIRKRRLNEPSRR